MRRTMVAVLLAGALAGCGRDVEAPPAPDGRASEPAAPAGADPVPLPEEAAPPTLDDVIEHDPRYVVGISYPPGAARDPGLAAALHAYAESARGELMEAVAGLDAAPTAPYELSLGFREVMATPQVHAVAADGSLYTGGAHGLPLVARFVWLPAQQRMLDAGSLLRSADDWDAVAGYVGEQLSAMAHTRAADEALAPEDRQRLLRTALKMIAEGTSPDAENFAQFEPVAADDGRIAALRFVFAPYQVGPYADGVRTVEVPADVLRPHLADEVVELFAD